MSGPVYSRVDKLTSGLQHNFILWSSLSQFLVEFKRAFQGADPLLQPITTDAFQFASLKLHALQINTIFIC